MNIYTSYYTNKSIPKNFIKVAISSKVFEQFQKDISIFEKDLSPSWSIFKEYTDKKDEKLYVKRFKEEILSKINLKEKIDFWKTKGENIVLLCYEKPNEFCHRHIIAEEIENLLDIKINEYGFENEIKKDYKIIFQETKEPIKSFRENYSFLSNMSKVNITYDGITYPTNEHFYVAMKVEKNDTINIFGKEYNIRKYITTIEKPGDTKKFGQTLTLRNNFDEIKLKIMEYGLRKKFNIEPYKSKLLNTNNVELIEGNNWKDTFWGVDNYTNEGENNLGKLLMKIRKELQDGLNLEKNLQNFEISNTIFKKNKNKFYLAITGHANVEKANKLEYINDNYDEELKQEIYNDIKITVKHIKEKYQISSNELVIISGMARGADEIFAEYAIKNNLDLILSIPHSVSWHQNRDKRSGNVRAQAVNYENILEYVKNKMKEENSCSGIYEIKKDYKNANYKYANFARNDFMVDICDGIFSYYKDISHGTEHAINSAIRANKYIGNCFDTNFKIYNKEINFIDNYENNNIRKLPIFKIHYNTDLFKFKTNVLIHGCNCFNTMGGGIAKLIKDKFPEVYREDCKTQKGDREKLGTFTFTKVQDENEYKNINYIVNLYSQYTHWDINDMFYIDSFKKGLNNIVKHFIELRKKENVKIHFSFPAIGLGLANGKIEEIYMTFCEFNKKYENYNISLDLCLHPKDLELNKKFHNLENNINNKENEINDKKEEIINKEKNTNKKNKKFEFDPNFNLGI